MNHCRLLLSHKILGFLLLLWMMPAGNTSFADTIYVAPQYLPDAGYYLPAPPSIKSPLFANDVLRWQWGKTQRNTARGEQASRESLWLPEEMIRIMSEVLDMEISMKKTPAIYQLIRKAALTGNKSAVSAKEKYRRVRPFALMNEHPWGQYDDETLRTNGSFPSGHTCMGWATALVVTEMAPEHQDSTLLRGYLFGENRIITGAHWQSDVDAGYLCGAAAVARMHANPQFEKDMRAARKEYCRLKKLPLESSADFPDAECFLPHPIDTADSRFYGELAAYWLSRELRPTPRGQQAIEGDGTSNSDLFRYFQKAIDWEMSKTETPALAQLVKYARKQLTTIPRALKKTTFRKRPYVQLGDTTSIPEEELSHINSSSYPSTHACLGWGLALLLTEIAPAYQNDLLRTGYEYGFDRLITGYHYASDLDAGRLLGCAIVARLHAFPEFEALLQAAKEEYKKRPRLQATVEASE